MMTDRMVEVRPRKEATMKSATISNYVNDAVFPTKKLDEKDKVLEFMRKPVPFCATAGHFEDAITGEPVEDRPWPWYRRGGWQWSDRDIYHVEKYDLELDSEFVAYALSH